MRFNHVIRFAKREFNTNPTMLVGVVMKDKHFSYWFENYLDEYHDGRGDHRSRICYGKLVQWAVLNRDLLLLRLL